MTSPQSTPTGHQPCDIALKFFEHLNAGSFEQAMALLAPDVVYEIVAPAPYGGTMNRDGLLAFFAKYLVPNLIGSMHTEVLGITAEGERVALETTIHAPGKNGRDYNNRFHVLLVIRDQMIVEVREYMDSARFIDFVTSK
ncbi:nuclear transport factor 2 family protein [Thiofilum flexile]|uniref:nuclear transport factor 2 family protein n=1 Tax=Thiofilum flexile TaxID=125627 RepID=UPI00036D4E5C|nr:nuclear transport factor 2 family protein [Thiofilum flexile]